MEQVVIGVDPHKLSATIEVVDQQEQLLGSGRFTTDRAGYSAMRNYAKAWPERVWAVEGANGAGRPLAQRLLEAGEHVVDVPAKLAARVRLVDTGHNRKTDALDAHSVAVVAVRTATRVSKHADRGHESASRGCRDASSPTRRGPRIHLRLLHVGVVSWVCEQAAPPADVMTARVSGIYEGRHVVGHVGGLLAGRPLVTGRGGSLRHHDLGHRDLLVVERRE